MGFVLRAGDILVRAKVAMAVSSMWYQKHNGYIGDIRVANIVAFYFLCFQVPKLLGGG